MTVSNLDEVRYVWDCPVCGTVNDEVTDKVCIVCDEPAPTAQEVTQRIARMQDGEFLEIQTSWIAVH